MASRPLTRIRGLDPNISALLSSSLGIRTAGDLLSANPLLLLNTLKDLNFKEITQMICLVADQIVPKQISALGYLQERSTRRRFLSTGISKLDCALGGGLPVGTITDICGAPGAGKTQFCISCAVNAVAYTLQQTQPDQQSNCVDVIFLDAELKLDSARLLEIACNSMPNVFSPLARIDAAHMVDQLLQRIEVRNPSSLSEFAEYIENLDTDVISKKTSLIVIDSIASLVRREQLSESDKERYLMKLANRLKRLAEACNCVILVTNQVTLVTTVTEDAADLLGDKIVVSAGESLIPALGPSWHHCVTTRLVAIESSPFHSSHEADSKKGFIEIRKSPIVAQVSLPYRITAAGIEIVPEVVE